MGGEIWGLDEKGEGIKKYKFVVTEQSWEFRVQLRGYRKTIFFLLNLLVYFYKLGFLSNSIGYNPLLL